MTARKADGEPTIATRQPRRGAPPTRRAFVAMLGAAAAALAARDPRALAAGGRAVRRRSAAPHGCIGQPTAHTGTTRWIGHC